MSGFFAGLVVFVSVAVMFEGLGGSTGRVDTGVIVIGLFLAGVLLPLCSGVHLPGGPGGPGGPGYPRGPFFPGSPGGPGLPGHT